MKPTSSRAVQPVRKRVKQARRNHLPSSPEEWFEEIRAAYQDARKAIPFGPLVGHRFGEEQLFHLAPAVALKFRDLPARKVTLKRATEAALSSYVANRERQASVLSDPRLAFAFCYLASHYGLGLVEVATVEAVMRFVERNAGRLTETHGRESQPARGRTARTLRAALDPRKGM